MKKIFLPGFMLIALAACGDGKDADKVVRQCGDYVVEMDFSDDGETLGAVINGDAVTLGRVVAASGAKYDGVVNDTPVTRWSKGDAWTMILDGDMVIECDAK